MSYRLSIFIRATLNRLADHAVRAAAARRRREERLALGSMSDHQLKDLGIGRSQVPALFPGHAAGHTGIE